MIAIASAIANEVRESSAKTNLSQSAAVFGRFQVVISHQLQSAVFYKTHTCLMVWYFLYCLMTYVTYDSIDILYILMMILVSEVLAVTKSKPFGLWAHSVGRKEATE